jgi:hypothetical protein
MLYHPGAEAYRQSLIAAHGTWSRNGACPHFSTNGNSLVIIITGTGERSAESYDGRPSGAPLLHVEYHSP